MIPPGLREPMDGPSYLGPATFMKLPFLSEPSQLDEVRPVEVSPPYDHAEITAQNANRVILEVISALAVKARPNDHTALRGERP